VQLGEPRVPARALPRQHRAHRRCEVTLSKSQAGRLADRVLAEATFGDVRVSIDDVRRGHLRFAKGQPTTEGDVEELSVTVTATKDGRSARVTSNRTDDAGLAALVKQAEELAA